jgi:hypothetical protein
MQASWRERERQFGLRLAEGSKMLGPQQRTIDVRLAASPAKRQLVFDGKPITLRF